MADTEIQPSDSLLQQAAGALHAATGGNLDQGKIVEFFKHGADIQQGAKALHETLKAGSIESLVAEHPRLATMLIYHYVFKRPLEMEAERNGILDYKIPSDVARDLLITASSMVCEIQESVTDKKLDALHNIINIAEVGAGNFVFHKAHQLWNWAGSIFTRKKEHYKEKFLDHVHDNFDDFFAKEAEKFPFGFKIGQQFIGSVGGLLDKVDDRLSNHPAAAAAISAFAFNLFIEHSYNNRIAASDQTYQQDRVVGKKKERYDLLEVNGFESFFNERHNLRYGSQEGSAKLLRKVGKTAEAAVILSAIQTLYTLGQDIFAPDPKSPEKPKPPENPTTSTLEALREQLKIA